MITSSSKQAKAHKHLWQKLIWNKIFIEMVIESTKINLIFNVPVMDNIFNLHLKYHWKYIGVLQ